MTVPNEVPLVDYVGNGTTKEFNVPFQYEAPSTLFISVNGVAPSTSDYLFNPNTGNFVFYTAPVSGAKVRIVRDTPEERDTDYDDNYNTFRPRTLNKDFDRLWRVIQEHLVSININKDGLAQEILDRIQADEDMLDYIMNQDNAIKQDYIQRDFVINTASIERDNRIEQESKDRDGGLKNYIDNLVALITGDPSFNGITTDFVTEDGETQRQKNDKVKRGIANKYDPVLTYQAGNIVLLDDSTEVISTVANNTNNPNVDMTGWVKTNLTTAIYDELGNSQQDINAQIGTPLLVGADTTGTQDVTAALNLLANPSGLSVMFLTKGDFKTGTVSIPANTICYMNGAKFIRKQYTNTPVIDVGENSLIVGAVVDGNKDVLGAGGGIRDYGIRLATGAKALFCTSKNNFKHGITCRSSDAGLSVSSKQRVLFCRTENNGFNAGPAGSADGINTANCNYALVFGCDSTSNARTDFVAETYNTITGDVDINLSVGVRFLMCTSDGSAYNSFNCEKVTAPTISNCKGSSAIVFRGSPNAVVTDNEVSAISAPEADNPTVLNCKIKNLTSSNEIFYLTGKNPTVENVKVTIDDTVVLSNTATVYITNSEGSGSVENVTVNRAYTGARLYVENAKNIKVATATNAKVLIARPEKSITIGDDFKLEKGRLELRTSAVPTVGYFKAGDAVVNSFYGGSIHGWQCTTSGLDAAAIWQQVGIRGLTKAASVANAAGANPTSAEYNDLLSKLRSCGILTT